MLKRLTTVLILSFMVLAIHSTMVFAEESDGDPVIHVNDHFDLFEEGAPSGWSVYGASDQNTLLGVEVEGREGKSVEFTLNEETTFTMERSLPSAVTGEIMLEAKVKFNRTDFYVPFFQIKSSSGIQSALLSFQTNGNIKAGSETVGTYEEDQWYHIAVALDLNNEEMAFYLDGEEVATGITYDRSADIENVRSFKHYSNGQADKKLHMYIDDVRVYEGIELADEEVFEVEEDDGQIPPDDQAYDPSAAQIIADLKEKNPNMDHPRIFANQADFDRIQSQLSTDSYLEKWYKDLRKNADKVLTEAVGKYELPDGRRMPAAKEARPKIETTALMYMLSGEEKYADRALEEMITLAKFPDWNHQNEFLNTAEATAGMAIGYDWLYDYMSEEERELVREAIRDKGLYKALDAHANNAWWVNRVEGDTISNWNAVSNGGIIMGALAIGDEEEEVAGAILARSIRSVEDYILREFNPDGGWSEGPGYWRYTIEYMVSYMAALESAVGTTYGHAEEEGLYKTAYFPLYMTGPQGSFNFADSSSNKMKMPELFWLAKQANDPVVAGQRLLLMEDAKQAGSVYDILWYDSEFYDKKSVLDLDKYFRKTEIATFRSSWNDSYATFAGILAGTGDASHAHSDVGNFVFQANGEHWAIDLGSDDYGLPGYFNYGQERYTYYRMKPEGHNTIVINPDDGFQQDYQSFNEIIEFESKPKGGFAITDMTPAYAKNVNETKRGLMLDQNRQSLIIQDEIRAKDVSDVWWFMHTKADIDVAEDGKSAILTLNGKNLWASIVTPDGELNDASFKVMDAKPLETSPNPGGQDPNNGIQKLAMELNDVQDVNVSVVLIPLSYGEEEPSHIPAYTPLDEWSIEDGEIDIPVATEINLDGQLMEGFKPNQFYYDIKLPFGTTEVPTIGASSDDELEIIQSDDIVKPAQVIVTDPNDPNVQTKYTIQFSILPSLEKPEGVTKFDIIDVDASDEQEGNPAINSIDGDYSTRWSAEGAQWIKYDLGEVQKVNTIGIALAQGHTRSSVFEFEVSEDGENWDKVYVGASTGTTEDMEYHSFIEKNARYVKILGNGNSSNNWNSYNEVEIFGLISNENPVIDASDQTITVGEKFDAIEGVTATDEEDGDLTDAIKVITNDVNTEKAGTYEVTYEVTDSDGNTVTKTITVTVVEDSSDEQDPAEDDDKDQDKKPEEDPKKEPEEDSKDDLNKNEKDEVDIPEETDKNKEPNNDVQTESGKELPNTATQMYTWLFVGAILLSIAAGLLVVFRKRSA